MRTEFPWATSAPSWPKVAAAQKAIDQGREQKDARATREAYGQRAEALKLCKEELANPAPPAPVPEPTPTPTGASSWLKVVEAQKAWGK